MEQLIEFTIETADGIIDCQAELIDSDVNVVYSVTILYPASMAGFGRSGIYCHEVTKIGNAYSFDRNNTILHHRIEVLEGRISDAICKVQ